MGEKWVLILYFHRLCKWRWETKGVSPTAGVEGKVTHPRNQDPCGRHPKCPRNRKSSFVPKLPSISMGNSGVCGCTTHRATWVLRLIYLEFILSCCSFCCFSLLTDIYLSFSYLSPFPEEGECEGWKQNEVSVFGMEKVSGKLIYEHQRLMSKRETEESFLDLFK